MDILTHGMVGLAVGSFSGDIGTFSNPFALGSLIGSLIPDGDILLQYWGDYAYLKNHRGASHSILGVTGISLVVAFMLSLLFPNYTFINIFLWTWFGSLTHLGLDMLNSYGAMVLWPFSNRKYGWGLLLIFDPVLFVLTLCIYVNNTSNLIVSIICMSLIMLYFLFRAYMLKWAASQVQLRFRHLGIHSIVVLPSIMRLFHWEFIIYTKTSVFTGFIDIITKKLSIRGCLKKTESWIEEAVMSTPLGKFFSEFTQHFHINSKKMGDNYYITMIDLRYFGKNSYLHHATAVLNSNLQMMQCIFHPYHQNRNVKILAEY